MSNRILKLINEFGERLKELVDKQTNTNSSINDIFEIICESDPTQNNKNSRWIIQTILNKGFLWEDIQSGEKSKVYDTLSLFEKHRKKINNINQRNINQYKTLGSVYKAISEFSKELSGKEIKQNDKELAYSQSVVFVDNEDGYKIVSPRSVFASKWFGRGTRWCTAADNNNMFNEYNESGPLLIVITPDGRKFQAHKETFYDSSDYINGNYETVFMDEDDEELSEQDIDKYWKYLKPISMYLGKYEYMSIYNDDNENNISLISKGAIEFNNLYNTHGSNYMNAEFILKSIQIEPTILDFIYSVDMSDFYFKEFSIENTKQYKEYIKSLRNNPLIISAYLEKYPENSICIPKTPSNNQLVKKILIDNFEKNKNKKSFLNLLPSQKTKKICDYVIENNIVSICDIPKNKITNEYVNKAIKEFYNHSNNLIYDIDNIPNEFITKELFIDFINRNNEIINQTSCLRKIIELKDKFIDDNDVLNTLANIKNLTIFNSLPIKIQYNNIHKISEILKDNSSDIKLRDLKDIIYVDKEIIDNIKENNTIDIDKSYKILNEKIDKNNYQLLSHLYIIYNKSDELLNLINNKNKQNDLKTIEKFFCYNDCNINNCNHVDLLNIIKNNNQCIANICKHNFHSFYAIVTKEELYKKDFFNLLINENKFKIHFFENLKFKFNDNVKNMHFSEEFLLHYIDNIDLNFNTFESIINDKIESKINISPIYIPSFLQTENIKNKMIAKDDFNKVFIKDDFSYDEKINIFALNVIKNNNYILYMPYMENSEKNIIETRLDIAKKIIDILGDNLQEDMIDFIKEKFGYNAYKNTKILFFDKNNLNQYSDENIKNLIDEYYISNKKIENKNCYNLSII